MTEQTAHKEGEARSRLPMMQRITRFLEWSRRTASSRLLAFLLIAIFFGTAATWVHNTAGKHIAASFHGDEIMVLQGAIPAAVLNLRVGEMSRWLARILHPGGLYHINQRLGHSPATPRSEGWEFSGWDYPAAYLDRNYKHPDAIHTDPNVQDYVFFMRLASALLAIASFCLVLWALLNRFGGAAAVAYAGLVLGSRLVFDQFQVFYTETTLFIIFNLAAFCYLRYGTAGPRPLSRYAVAWLGVLSAAALSAKLSGVMVVAMLACMVLVDVQRHRPRFHIEIYLLFFLAFIYLINVPMAGSWFEYIDKTMANVYNYANRFRFYGSPDKIYLFRTQEYGLGVMEFLLSVPGLGYFIILAFLGGLLWLAVPPRRELLPLYALGALIILSVSSFSNQMVSIDRNMASPYAAASFIIAVAVGDLLNRLPSRLLAGGVALALLLVFLTAAIQRLQEIAPIEDAFIEAISNPVAQCRSLAALGLSDKATQALRERVRGDVAAFPRVPRYFQNPPIIYAEYRKKILGKYRGYQCLVAYREKHSNTKQVTNFFGPKYYRLAGRMGDFFFFVPKAPTPDNLAAEAGDRSITLSWTIPGNAGVSGYQFQTAENGQPWGDWQDIDMKRVQRGQPASSATRPRVRHLLVRKEQRIKTAGEMNRFVIQKLTNGRTYRVQLRAHTDFGGEGAPAEVAATPTRRAAP